MTTADLASRGLVLLDLDGTISEPKVGIRNGYRAAFEAVGLDVPSNDVVDSHIGPPLRQAFPLLGIAEADLELAVAAYRAVYDITGWAQNELYPHVPDVVTTLAGRGHIALATAKPTAMAARILAHFELIDLFAFVGGASMDTSRDTKAEVIGHVLDEMNMAPAATVMVGDRAADVEGAAEHGIPTVGVSWGHGTGEELRDAGAVEVVDDPRELLDLLR